MQKENVIQDNLDAQIKVISELKKNTNVIKKILEILLEARDKDKRIYVIGNGGSASTATHFVSDLLKTSITKNEKRFKAMSLSDNIPVILAWSNDKSYDSIFVEQLKNFLEEGDIVIAISGSGNSLNVINAINYANKINAKTISLSGRDGGKLSKISEINLIVPSNDMLTIETVHLCICHLLTSIIRSNGEPLFSY
jgi:D-sedoheptulose 7-phosphate isomerase